MAFVKNYFQIKIANVFWVFSEILIGHSQLRGEIRVTTRLVYSPYVENGVVSLQGEDEAAPSPEEKVAVAIFLRK